MSRIHGPIDASRQVALATRLSTYDWLQQLRHRSWRAFQIYPGFGDLLQPTSKPSESQRMCNLLVLQKMATFKHSELSNIAVVELPNVLDHVQSAQSPFSTKLDWHLKARSTFISRKSDQMDQGKMTWPGRTRVFARQQAELATCRRCGKLVAIPSITPLEYLQLPSQSESLDAGGACVPGVASVWPGPELKLPSTRGTVA